MSALNEGTMLRKATVFMVLDNASRLGEPILKMACAVAFVGGAWGAFAYLESMVLVLMRFSLLGLEKGVVWLGGKEPDDREFVRRSTRTFLFVALVSSVVALVGTVLLAYLADSSVFRQAPGSQWILAAVPFQAVATLVLQALASRSHLGESIVVRNLLLPGVTFALPLGALMLMPAWKESLLPLAYLGGSVLAATVSLGAFAWRYRKSLGGLSFLPWPGSELVRYSLPVSVTDILQSVALRTDHALLFQFGGTREVEVYSVAIMVAKAIQAVRESFDGTTLSFFSRRESETLGPIKRQAARYVYWVVAGIQQPLVWGILLFGSGGLSLLDPAYATGYGTLLATAVLFTLSLPGMLGGLALMGLGRTLLLPIVQVSFLVVFVVLNALLIPSMGSLGAGLSLGFASLVSSTFNFLLVRRISGRWLLDGQGMLAPLAGSLLFVPLIALQSPGGGDTNPVALSLWGVLAGGWMFHVLRKARNLRQSMPT